MPKILAITSQNPNNSYPQAAVTEMLIKTLDKINPDVIRRINRASGVETRHLCLPLEAYPNLSGMKNRMHVWQEVAYSLGSIAINRLLKQSQVPAKDIGHFFFTSITGMSAPSIDALLVDDLEMSASIKRTPIFGLGCLGGAALISRACDYVKAYPDQVAIVLAVELCTLTWQKYDHSMANIIATSLFGDGCAAVLIAGDRYQAQLKPKAQLIDSAQAFFPGTRDLMGWSIEDSGFKIILSPGVPDISETLLPPIIDSFLAKHGLSKNDIKHWIAHPGGPKVISALERGLGLHAHALDITKASLKEQGNLSSVSVLNVLERTLATNPKPGDHGLLFAMGPGFCAEMVLITC